MRRVQRHRIGPVFQVKNHLVGRRRAAMAGIVDPGQVGLALMTRITQGHIVAVRVFHPVQTPPKDLARIRGVGNPRVGGLAKIKLRAGLVRGQKVRLAIGGRLLLHPREPAFHLGPVFIRPRLD